LADAPQKAISRGNGRAENSIARATLFVPLTSDRIMSGNVWCWHKADIDRVADYWGYITPRK
jgi:hypothetical protein